MMSVADDEDAVLAGSKRWAVRSVELPKSLSPAVFTLITIGNGAAANGSAAIQCMTVK